MIFGDGLTYWYWLQLFCVGFLRDAITYQCPYRESIQVQSLFGHECVTFFGFHPCSKYNSSANWMWKLLFSCVDTYPYYENCSLFEWLSVEISYPYLQSTQGFDSSLYKVKWMGYPNGIFYSWSEHMWMVRWSVNKCLHDKIILNKKFLYIPHKCTTVQIVNFKLIRYTNANTTSLSDERISIYILRSVFNQRFTIFNARLGRPVID